jgi:hypothetical protein
MCLNLKKFYLSALLNQYKCMHIPLELSPPWIVAQYDLLTKVHRGCIYLEMQRAVWGLPQAGILANKLLCKRLAPHGYYECKQTPGLWKHTSWPISFTLVVDNFGVKYTNQGDVNYLIGSLRRIMNLPKTGMATFIAESNSSGITMHVHWTSRCQDTS